MRQFPPRAGKRQGITLLEVIFALVIFMGSFVALNQLVSIATDNAIRVDQQSQATLLCQAKLAEINAGIVSLTASQGDYTPFTQSQDGGWSNTIDDNWQWKMMTTSEVEGVANLYLVQVWVMRETGGKKVEVTLSQMVFDPTQRGSTADVPSTGSTTGGG
jgi:Tfp pilus assembly protein PilV